MTGAHMARHRRRHDADGAGAGDQHIFADQVERERGVDGVTERVENGADFVRHVVRQRHHVERRQAEILGKGARHVDADAAGLGIEMEPPCPAGAAGLADQMPFAGHPLADFRSSTSSPSSTISPANSCPAMSGTGMVFCAHSSQFQMWMSVPQMPVLLTFISTSSGPISGTGSCCSHRPSAACALTRAFIPLG